MSKMLPYTLVWVLISLIVLTGCETFAVAEHSKRVESPLIEKQPLTNAELRTAEDTVNIAMVEYYAMAQSHESWDYPYKHMPLDVFSSSRLERMGKMGDKYKQAWIVVKMSLFASPKDYKMQVVIKPAVKLLLGSPQWRDSLRSMGPLELWQKIPSEEVIVATHLRWAAEDILMDAVEFPYLQLLKLEIGSTPQFADYMESLTARYVGGF